MLGVKRGGFEQVGRAAPAIHGGADFVGNVGDELAACPHGVQGGVARGGELAVGLLAFADVACTERVEAAADPRGWVFFRRVGRRFSETHLDREHLTARARPMRLDALTRRKHRPPRRRVEFTARQDECAGWSADELGRRPLPQPLGLGIGTENDVAGIHGEDRLADGVKHGGVASPCGHLHVRLAQDRPHHRTEDQP